MPKSFLQMCWENRAGAGRSDRTGQRSRPRRRLHVVKDDPDNRILECAIAAHADAIVTGDRELLALREYEGIRIISLREYLDEG